MRQVSELSMRTFTRRDTTILYLIGIGGGLSVFLLTLLISQNVLAFWWQLLICLLCVPVLTVLHEGLHGLGFWLFTRHATFGLKWSKHLGPTAYATAKGQRLSRAGITVSGLLPQVLTLLCLCLFFVGGLRETGGWLAYTCLFIAGLNLGGGGMDILVVYKIWRLPRGYLYEDAQDSMVVWSTK